MTIPSSPIVPVSPTKVKAPAPHPNPMESEAAVAKGDLKARRAPNRGVAPQSHGLSRDGRPLGDLETLRVSNLNPLQRLRLERGIPVKDMVEVVQALYPKYDKTVQSKVEHGNEYGINLRPDAMRALLNRFAPDRPSAARAPRRTKPYRVQARLSERVYGQLQRLTAQTGTTMQDFLEQLIVDFLSNGKEERTHGTQVEHDGHRREDRQPAEDFEQGAL